MTKGRKFTDDALDQQTGQITIDEEQATRIGTALLNGYQDSKAKTHAKKKEAASRKRSKKIEKKFGSDNR